jgi:N,N'-diacetyllegionaminate synthase
MIINERNYKDKVYIVAEIGNNHEGSFTLAEELLGKAAESGADAVKFQTFIPELFVSSEDPARLERLKKFQLSFEQFESLSKLAGRLGVDFFSTPLDLESAKFLNGIQSVFKIASSDNTFYPLIETVAEFGKPMIISTGLADIPLLNKVQKTVMDIWEKNGEVYSLALLHCITGYPVPIEQVNLGAIQTLRSKFPELTIGYSDHTLGIEVSTYAVAAGARIIEKHFTLDKNYSDFRDHQLSADPAEFRKLTDSIRSLESILGTGEKVVQQIEEGMKDAVRRSIAAAKDLSAGSTIQLEDLIWLRPGTGGFAPGSESQLLNKITARNIHKGELIQVRDIL